jgi:hypothetical protein
VPAGDNFGDLVIDGTPPLWSSGSWLQIQKFRVLFQEIPDFLRNGGSGTGSTQPREYLLEATWKKE